MKAWSVSELDNVVSSLKALWGTRLQEVKTVGNDLALGFYTDGDLLWLWIDLNSIRPSLLPWTALPLPLNSKKTPLNLFLRAHFVGHKLTHAERVEVAGRVVVLTFASGAELELRLFPHGPNVLARSGDKKISWAKVEPLGAAPVSTDPGVERDLEVLREQWLAIRGGGKGGGKKASKNDPAARVRLELERKEKALRKVDQELQRKIELPWRAVGEWLKNHQTLDVRTEWAPFVDKRRKLSWNIDHCFEKARDLEGKIFGTEQRQRLLVEEIEKLKVELTKPVNEMTVKPVAVLQPIKSGEVSARTLRLSDELVAVAGKSAADNLRLLRKARAWDFWLHLRDEPGSHVILFRNKSTSVSDTVLRQVIGWFVRLQFGAKYSKHVGDKLSVIVTECRHVRPIKGDRLGRVNYHDERTLIFQVPP